MGCCVEIHPPAPWCVLSFTSFRIRGLRRIVTILIVIFTSFSAACNANVKEKKESELTKTMKPVCIGRYLLDIPAQAEFIIGSTLLVAQKGQVFHYHTYVRT
jgi:hypothetical protein